jgi:hypothetical protein
VGGTDSDEASAKLELFAEAGSHEMRTFSASVARCYLRIKAVAQRIATLRDAPLALDTDFFNTIDPKLF